MTPSTESLFVLLLVLLYLHDSLALLYGNEALLEWRRQPRLLFGSDMLRVSGKELVLPSPWTPWRPLFRLAWHVQPALPDAAQPAPTDFAKLARALVPMRWCLPQIAAGLFVGLPLCVYRNTGWTPFLLVVAVIYAGIASAVVLLWFARRELGVSKRRFAALAFECLACPPCALNIIRHVAVALPICDDAVMVARAKLAAAEAGAAIGEILRRVDAEMEATDDGSEQWRELAEFRARLAEAAT